MAERNNFKYKYPGYLANNETITSAKLNSIITAINTLIENLMNHDHIGVTDSYNQTTRGPKLVGYNCLVEQTINNFCLADFCVTTIKLADLCITKEKIADNAVTTVKIHDNAITTSKIIDEAITREKLPNYVINEDKLDPYIFEKIFDMIYPMGSTYITTLPQCPLNRGTWRLIQQAQSRVLQVASNPNQAGTTIEAGLPDHVHAVRYNRGGGGGSNGGDLNHEQPDTDVYWRNTKTVVDTVGASNTIYGKSDTVQPPAFLINIFQRVPNDQKVLKITSSPSTSTIQVIINNNVNNTYTSNNGKIIINVRNNDTYKYTVTNSGYVSESGEGIISNSDVAISVNLQLIEKSITLSNPTNPVEQVSIYSIKKTGSYIIELAGGKGVNGDNISYCETKGGKALLNYNLNAGDNLYIYTIRGGYVAGQNDGYVYPSAKGGCGVGIKINNSDWICVVGGGAACGSGERLGTNRTGSGGGYIGGNITGFSKKDYGRNATNGEVGSGTGNTQGSGGSITMLDYNTYGGSGYLISNYNGISASLSSNVNNGNAYIKITYNLGS